MKKIAKLTFRFIAGIIGLLVIVGVYATYIEGKLLTVKKHDISIDEKGTNKLKLVQITDTQLGDYYSLEQLKKVALKINDIKPDIVVFTGDLIDNAAKYQEVSKVSEILSKIKADKGKYAIYGNHDIGGGAMRYYKDIMGKAGFKVIKNSKETIALNNRKLHIFGGDDALLGNHNSAKTMEGISEKDINLLLIHEPDLIDQYKSYPIDLALSGHSHGGQVSLPFYGPLIKIELTEKYNKGMYSIENKRKTRLYVSSGLGNTKLPFRFGNIPSIESFSIIY